MESFEFVESLAGIDAAEWNQLAGPQPFVRHEFLSALIECGCSAARSGWLPQFLLLRRSGALVGAMPLYAKSHSYADSYTYTYNNSYSYTYTYGDSNGYCLPEVEVFLEKSSRSLASE